MDDITIEKMWNQGVAQSPGLMGLDPHELEQCKIMFFAGAEYMIYINKILQTKCKSREEYINEMNALLDECEEKDNETIEHNEVIDGMGEKPDRKPRLKIVVDNSKKVR